MWMGMWRPGRAKKGTSFQYIASGMTSMDYCDDQIGTITETSNIKHLGFCDSRMNAHHLFMSTGLKTHNALRSCVLRCIDFVSLLNI